MTDATDKPSKNEEEYFARQNLAALAALRAEKDAARARAGVDARALTCPKCGGDLREVEVHHVKLDRCAGCEGVFLDRGELEILLRHTESPSLGAVFRDLFGPKRS